MKAHKLDRIYRMNRISALRSEKIKRRDAESAEK